MGTTGTPWAYQQLGLEPDVVAFSKKVQLGGIMAGRRVDDVADNVFQVSGRINSTWGGGLIDMVRSTRILEHIESTGLIDSAGPKGRHFVERLHKIAEQYADGTLRNIRGRGLLVAVDLPDGGTRDTVLAWLRDHEHVLALPSGERAIRFRPALSVSEQEIDEAVDALDRAVAQVVGGAK
jgi:L-lysine 6-transaminase